MNLDLSMCYGVIQDIAKVAKLVGNGSFVMSKTCAVFWCKESFGEFGELQIICQYFTQPNLYVKSLTTE